MPFRKGFECGAASQIVDGKYWGFNNIPPENLRHIELGWVELVNGAFLQEGKNWITTKSQWTISIQGVGIAAHAIKFN